MIWVTLKDPASKGTVCVQWEGAGVPTANDVVALGYPGWQLVTESAAMPVEQRTAAQIETSRLNALSNADLVAELKAWMATHFLPQP
jgi:hypothetical protein